MRDVSMKAPLRPVDEPVAGTPSTSPDGFCITCHENEIPPFVETELVRLYGNIYSSLLQFRNGGALHAATSTCVIRKGDKITSVFLYQRDKRKVRVLNEGISIDSGELQRFARHLFSTCAWLDLIDFHAVQPDTQQLEFPYQRYNCLEDIVLSLPEHRAAYLDSLGNSTRNYIKRYLNKLTRSFPSFRHRVQVRDEIAEQDIRDVIRLNGARMAEKGKASGIGEDEVRHIVRLVRECGMLSVVLIDDRICAGTINYQVGDNYFLEVIAHDPAYNEYRLGTLCCYLTICECIARGGAEYHFLWGRNDYKFRLLGVERELDHLTIYRSGLRLFLHPDAVLKNLAASFRRKAQRRLHEVQRHDDAWDRLAATALNAIRRLRT